MRGEKLGKTKNQGQIIWMNKTVDLEWLDSQFFKSKSNINKL